MTLNFLSSQRLTDYFSLTPINIPEIFVCKSWLVNLGLGILFGDKFIAKVSRNFIYQKINWLIVCFKIYKLKFKINSGGYDQKIY